MSEDCQDASCYDQTDGFVVHEILGAGLTFILFMVLTNPATVKELLVYPSLCRFFNHIFQVLPKRFFASTA